MSSDFTLALADEQATLECAAKLAAKLIPGLAIYLHGNLGAGKTTFVRGVLNALGYQGKVKSPTYTLVELYEQASLPFPVFHFDLYRFQDEEEWHASGFRDYFNPHSVCFVEWPEKAGKLIPAADIDIRLSHLDEGRAMQIHTNTELGKQCLSTW